MCRYVDLWICGCVEEKLLYIKDRNSIASLPPPSMWICGCVEEELLYIKDRNSIASVPPPTM